MFISRDEVRDLDRRAIEDFAVPGIVLMENAGRGVAELLLGQGVHGPVVVCCGKGNNGGDGMVIARHLDNHGIQVRVLLFAAEADLARDALTNYRIISRSGLTIEHPILDGLDATALLHLLDPAEWIVDALFGTGLTGPLHPPFDRVVAAINKSPARVLAVDIPSGLDCDTGRPLGPTVRANHTATFVALKMGFTTLQAKEWLGQIHVVDIGAPRRLLDTIPSRIPGRSQAGH
jgi:NAD(P)H-hydrate epimerase